MSQQMNRMLAAAGLAAALLLAVPAPSRAASFREPSFVTAGLVGRVWSWLKDLASPAPSQPGQISAPATRTAAGGTPPPTGPPPSGTSESGSHIDPDGKP
jgi:hypothetical protein